MDEEYIGDGVYVSHDGYQIWLAANDPTHKCVALEPAVLLALIEYACRIGIIRKPDV